MDDPRFEPREQIEAARGGRPFDGAPDLWCQGSLAGLGRPCVAIVGTRAATAYGRQHATAFAEQLGRAGCCIVSGLALGIDAAAHEGAMRAQAPTIGVLGSGHGRFFPARNRELAARMVAAGGALLSPYPPDRIAQPWQFLERNGIVAALCDAVVVIEAPARSGAINTAGWAAGRIPVLAVPGDVDRKHVQGCLALIRDGATLARSADDVLEALGRLPGTQPALATEPIAGPVAGAILRELDAGPAELDALTIATGVPPAALLAALTMLELEGLVQSHGASTFARVGIASRGEQRTR